MKILIYIQCRSRFTSAKVGRFVRDPQFPNLHVFDEGLLSVDEFNEHRQREHFFNGNYSGGKPVMVKIFSDESLNEHRKAIAAKAEAEADHREKQRLAGVKAREEAEKNAQEEADAEAKAEAKAEAMEKKAQRIRDESAEKAKGKEVERESEGDEPTDPTETPEPIDPPVKKVAKKVAKKAAKKAVQ